MSDDQRRAILSRRASFIAAAVAGLATGCDRSDPNAITPDDARVRGTDAVPAEKLPVPTPCLTVAPPHDAGAPPAFPRPCLSIRPPAHRPVSDAKDPCDPPYTFDEKGLKIYKKECL